MSTNATQWIRGAVPVAGALAIMLAPIAGEGHARASLAIAVAMVLFWITDVLHPAIVGFIGCFLFTAVGGVEFETAFAGFGTATPWFLYGSLLLISAADRAGVIAWLGDRTPRAVTGSVMAASAGLLCAAYLLGLVVPSGLARATLLLVPALAWARRSSTPMTTTGGLVLVAMYGAATFDRVLPTPAGVVALDVATALALLMGVAWLSREASPDDAEGGEPGEPPAVDVDWRIAALVAVTAALWVTTPVHGLAPAIVGLAAGLITCFPGLTRATAQKAISPDPLAIILAGAALSIPAVLLETKAADVVVGAWSAATEGWSADGMAAYWATTLYRLLSPDGGPPQLPILDGHDGVGSGAAWAAAGVTLLSLYQSPALILGMSVGRCRQAQMLKLGLVVLAALSLAVILF